MKRLTFHESLERLEHCGFTEAEMSFRNAGERVVTVQSGAGRQEFVVSSAMEYFRAAEELLIWVQEANVSSRDGGILQFLECGSATSMTKYPGFLFNQTEFEMAKGLVRIATAFEWNALCCSKIPPACLQITDVFLTLKLGGEFFIPPGLEGGRPDFLDSGLK
jgi:hypothetical protein